MFHSNSSYQLIHSIAVSLKISLEETWLLKWQSLPEERMNRRVFFEVTFLAIDIFVFGQSVGT